MPEGAECRLSADFLDMRLRGKRVFEAAKLGGRYRDRPPTGFDEFRATLGNTTIVREVGCKGKFMWWDMGAWKMWYTYGMTGQWTSDYTPHSAFAFAYRMTPDEDGFLYFNDPRHFGTIRFVNDERLHAKKLASLGPDMLSDPPDDAVFSARIKKKAGRTIVEALMDQSVVSGVGNYVKAESLYLAEISPLRSVDSLTARELARLRVQVNHVLKAAYASKGASFLTYKNPDGSSGETQQHMLVYGKQTDPMGHPVVRTETADGRTTHWVPQIQK